MAEAYDPFTPTEEKGSPLPKVMMPTGNIPLPMDIPLPPSEPPPKSSTVSHGKKSKDTTKSPPKRRSKGRSSKTTGSVANPIVIDTGAPSGGGGVAAVIDLTDSSETAKPKKSSSSSSRRKDDETDSSRDVHVDTSLRDASSDKNDLAARRSDKAVFSNSRPTSSSVATSFSLNKGTKVALAKKTSLQPPLFSSTPKLEMKPAKISFAIKQRFKPLSKVEEAKLEPTESFDSDENESNERY